MATTDELWSYTHLRMSKTQMLRELLKQREEEKQQLIDKLVEYGHTVNQGAGSDFYVNSSDDGIIVTCDDKWQELVGVAGYTIGARFDIGFSVE
jgi:phage gp45-like